MKPIVGVMQSRADTLGDVISGVAAEPFSFAGRGLEDVETALMTSATGHAFERISLNRGAFEAI
jgi:L-asparaginase II